MTVFRKHYQVGATYRFITSQRKVQSKPLFISHVEETRKNLYFILKRTLCSKFILIPGSSLVQASQFNTYRHYYFLPIVVTCSSSTCRSDNTRSVPSLQSSLSFLCREVQRLRSKEMCSPRGKHTYNKSSAASLNLVSRNKPYGRSSTLSCRRPFTCTFREGEWLMLWFGTWMYGWMYTDVHTSSWDILVTVL